MTIGLKMMFAIAQRTAVPNPECTYAVCHHLEGMLRPAIVHCPRDPPIIRPSLPPPLKAAMPAPFRPPASYSLTFIEDINYPRLWSETHVAHWLYWAIREFSLEGVPLNQFHMRGKDICAMGKEAFLARAPPFMGDILWEHLEILQKVGALRLATLVSGAENDVTSPPTPSRVNIWWHGGW
uniref:PNT domain-containing protein n=1 Tax=Timema bartmani TaxID=61472 RepID=A0A7R9I2Q9_9NEOP|nr:unnamed protein product [Timema bartmani]